MLLKYPDQNIILPKYKSTELIGNSSITIDSKYPHILKTLASFTKSYDRIALAQGIESIVVKDPAREKIILSLSVRTGFDAILQAYNFEPGSEIICTCINIPNMLTIMRYHGLIPINVEVDQHTLSSTLEDIKKAYKPGKTKAIMVSYIFGAVYDATEIFKWAKQHNVVIFEDNAEAFSGPNFNGHSLADYSLFSFGTIKNSTSFGGAIVIVRDNEAIYRKAKFIQEKYDILPRSKFLKKIIINSLLMPVINVNKVGVPVFYIVEGVLNNKLIQVDYRDLIVQSIRGFQTTPQKYLEAFRLQMPTPMIYMLLLRLSQFDQKEFNQKQQVIDEAAKLLSQHGIQIPGIGLENRTYWLFPVIPSDKLIFFKKLVEKGCLGTYLKSTQLKVNGNPVGHSYDQPVKSDSYFKKIVYVPINMQLCQTQTNKVINACLEAEQETRQELKEIKKQQLMQKPKL